MLVLPNHSPDNLNFDRLLSKALFALILAIASDVVLIMSCFSDNHILELQVVLVIKY